MKKHAEQILNELEESLNSFDFECGEKMAEAILARYNKGGKILGIAAGRMGFAVKSFVMRLNQMGISASTLGDSYVAPLKPEDIVIAASSSGKTKGIVDFAHRAKTEIGTLVWSVTSSADSPLGKISDGIVKFLPASTTRTPDDASELLKSNNLEKSQSNIASIQPMSSLNEQSVLLFFDCIILHLMELAEISNADMNARHFNIE